MSDYREEIRVSNEILSRVVEAYRKIRNTLRALLGNLHDFDPQQDALAPGQLVALDRWAIARTHELQQQVVAAYRSYSYHLIYQMVHNFCVIDLGGFYLDILKDRLYTTRQDSKPRRSAQNALYHIAQALLRLIAPVLSFTAEEAWRVVSPRDATVFIHTWHQFPEIEEKEKLLNTWDDIRQLREMVNKHLEEKRGAGQIGSSLAAELDIYANGVVHKSLSHLGNDLRFVFITSRATVHHREGPVTATVTPSPHRKCERCWHYRADVGADASHPEICGRCVANLYGSGEPRAYA